MKANTNMLLRVLTAVIFIPVILVIIYVLPDIATAISLGIISAIAIYEALVSTDFLKHSRVAGWSMLFAALIPVWSYLGIHYIHALAGMYIYVVILFCETIASKNTLGLERLGGAFFLTVFIPLALSAFVRMRYLEHWRFYVLLPFVIAFLSDASAYFTGMAIGKHKLAPDLSPKKTVEGAVGGLVGATVAAVLAGIVYHMGAPTVEVNYAALAFYGLLGSGASQLGDLSFSCIKREYGIKDFGNILPGHGGILDRFDSVIFCAPLVELLLYLFPAVK